MLRGPRSYCTSPSSRSGAEDAGCRVARRGLGQDRRLGLARSIGMVRDVRSRLVVMPCTCVRDLLSFVQKIMWNGASAVWPEVVMKTASARGGRTGDDADDADEANWCMMLQAHYASRVAPCIRDSRRVRHSTDSISIPTLPSTPSPITKAPRCRGVAYPATRFPRSIDA